MREYKADLHAHPGFWHPNTGFRFTEWTSVRPEELVMAAEARGLDIVPVTEFQSDIWSYYFGRNAPSGLEIDSKYLIRTRELGTKPPQGRELNINNPLPNRIDINVVCPVVDRDLSKLKYGVDFDYALDAARASGGAVVLAHCKNKELIERLLDEGKIDSFEQFNWLANQEVETEETWGVAVSDAHLLRDYGRVHTALRMPKPDYVGIAEAIKSCAFVPIYKRSLGNSLLSARSKARYAASLIEGIARRKLGLTP